MSIVLEVKGRSLLRSLPAPIVGVGGSTILADPNGVTITSNPSPWVGDVTDDIVFVGAASSGDASALVYQWQEFLTGAWSNVSNGGRVSGATTATLTITGALEADVGRSFRLAATNDTNTRYSAGATVSLDAASGVTIDTQPNSPAVTEGDDAIFTIAATSGNGSALSYQWEFFFGSWQTLPEGAPYTGTQTATMTIDPTTLIMSGTALRCLVTNDQGTVISDQGVITVTEAGGETFYLLTEEGDYLLTEEGDRLLSEEAA